MKTLQSFLQEFAIFKSPENSEGQDTNDMEFDVPSQDDANADVDAVASDKDGDTDLDGQTCQCQCDCPCCQKAREDGDQNNDPNIEVIEPEEGGFDIDDETGMEDDDTDSDPTKEYDLF